MCLIQRPKSEEDAKAASEDKARHERLSKLLASSTLPALWLGLRRNALFESTGDKDMGDLLDSKHLHGGQTAATAFRFSIDGKEMLLGGLACPARLPLCFFQLAELACITKLTLTNIHGLTALEMAMFIPLEGLESVTISACPALKAVVLNSTVGAVGVR